MGHPVKLDAFSSLALCLIVAATPSADVSADTVRERIRERIQERHQQRDGAASDATDEQWGAGRDASCAEWARKASRLEKFAGNGTAGPVPDRENIAYGPEALAKLDVFLPKPANSEPAPIIVMVHGGGWCIGDKSNVGVTANKVARWVPRGFVFVSVNYPMVNDGANAAAQARHVARAVAFVQRNADKWGGDPARLILMGHSAGAHLVSLVGADALLRKANALRPVLGTISLDAGALDVVRQMPNVYPFLRTRYREAFGRTEAEWIAASPFHQLDGTASAWLGVCSTTRRDDPCGQAQAYAEKGKSLGLRAAVLAEHLGHGAINKELGLPGRYTDDVEAFMASLDSVVGKLLSSRSASRQ